MKYAYCCTEDLDGTLDVIRFVNRGLDRSKTPFASSSEFPAVHVAVCFHCCCSCLCLKSVALYLHLHIIQVFDHTIYYQQQVLDICSNWASCHTALRRNVRFCWQSHHTRASYSVGRLLLLYRYRTFEPRHLDTRSILGASAATSVHNLLLLLAAVSNDMYHIKISWENAILCWGGRGEERV